MVDPESKKNELKQLKELIDELHRDKQYRENVDRAAAMFESAKASRGSAAS